MPSQPPNYSQVKSQELYPPPSHDSDEAIMPNEAELEALITPVILPPPLRNPRSDFQLAIFRGSVADVSQICTDISASKSPVINQRDEAGYFPLHSAVALGLLDEFGLNCRESLEICQMLIDNGADVTCRDKDGNTPVHWASRAGHIGVLGLLLVRNCPLDVQNHAGETALHWAMRAGERGAGAVKVLVENGARVNVFNRNFRRPLDVAAEGFAGLHEGTERNCSTKNDSTACSIKPDIRERRTSRWDLMRCSSQCRTLVLYHQECLDHLAKSDADWEVPDRIENIMSTLTTRTTELCVPDDELSFKPCELTVSNEFERATLELLSRIHSAEYLAFINDLSKELERKRKQHLIEETQSNKEGIVQEKPRNVVPFTPMVCDKF
jgi:ankyrin repeat protein